MEAVLFHRILVKDTCGTYLFVVSVKLIHYDMQLSSLRTGIGSAVQIFVAPVYTAVDSL